MAKNPSYTDFYKRQSQCAKEWRDADSSGIYLAWGNSDFFLEKVTTAFKNVKSKVLNTPYNRHEAKSLDFENFGNIWQSAGMFDETEIHIIDHIETNKNFWKLLESISDSNNINNHVLITFQGNKVLTKLQQQVERLKINQIPCFEPNKFDFKKISSDLCRKYKLNLSQEGNEFLIHCMGEDLYQLENEIIKLSLIFHDNNKSLSSKELAPYMGFLREDHAFQLTDFLLQGNTASAQSLITDLISRGESSIAILGILSRHIRNTILIGDSIKNGNNTNSFSKDIRLPDFIIKRYNQYVKKVNLKNAANALAMCQSADIKLKSSKINDELVLGEIIAVIS